MAIVPGVSRQKQAALSRKQERFIAEYVAGNGNASQAARKAGYRGNSNVVGVTAHRTLNNAKVKSQLARELARIDVQITPGRVQRRLDEISHASQSAGQFGPAVRAEELLGKSIGMWIDQSVQLSGQLKDEHIAALLDLARRRQAEPIELEDDRRSHESAHGDDDRD